jgi:hypothetical protein
VIDYERLPIDKTADLLYGNALYTYDIKGSTGPYVRAFAESKAFSTDPIAAYDATFITTFPDGSTESTFVPTNETFHVATRGSRRSSAKASASTRPFSRRRATRTSTSGSATACARTSTPTRSSRSTTPDPGDRVPVRPDLLRRRDRVHADRDGSPSRGRSSYSTDVELFADFQTLDQLSVNWRNTLSLRIARNLSLNLYATSSTSR